MPRIKTHCQNWPTNLVIVGGKVSQDEVAIGLNRVRRNALFEVPFKQGQVLVAQAITKARTLGEEEFLKFSGFAHVVSGICPPMNSNAAEEATIVPIGVQRQNSVLLAKPIRKTPVPEKQRMTIQDDFDIHHLCPLVDLFGVGCLQVFQPQLFLLSHPVLCRCKRFEPGRNLVVSLIEIHLAISPFSVSQLNYRAEFKHEA